MTDSFVSALNGILSAVGPHGLFAILGTMALVRVIMAGRYLAGAQAFLVMGVIASVIGMGSVYWLANVDSIKAILGGAFITPIGTLITVETLKALFGSLYIHTGKEVFRALFFLVSPKPIKRKQGNTVVKIPPHPTMTQFMDLRKDPDQTQPR